MHVERIGILLMAAAAAGVRAGPPADLATVSRTVTPVVTPVAAVLQWHSHVLLLHSALHHLTQHNITFLKDR